MLVLSRKSGERIRVGENIVLTVIKCQGKTVRIGIEAPADVRVLRAELPVHSAALPASVTNLSPLAVKRLTLTKAAVESVPSSSHTDASAARRRAEPRHPQRWSVANMRDRVTSGTASAESSGSPRSRS